MNFQYVVDADGTPAIADDMPPIARAVAFLVEHANRQKAATLPPCRCEECEAVRARVRVERTARPGELLITLGPVAP